MRTTFRVASAAFSLLLASGAAQAQSLILDEAGQGTREIPLASGSQVQILPNGNIALRSASPLECGDTGGNLTVNLTASPTSITAGDSTQVNWNIEGPYTSCNATQGSGTSWSSLNVNSRTGSETFNLQGTTTFSLSCTGSSGTDTDSVTVSVGGGSDPDDPPPGCAGVAPSGTVYAGASDARANGNEDWRTFQEAFALPWPGNSGVNRRLYVPRNAYIALQFQPSAIVGQSGRMATELDLAGREKWMSISECPGDFRTALPNECKRFDVATNMFWANEDAQGEIPFGHCRLEQGKTYYFNVIFGEENNPAQENCGSQRCIFLGQTFTNR